MMCGKPIIVSDASAMANIVRKEQCGVVVPYGDVPALTHALKTCREDPQLRAELWQRFTTMSGEGTTIIVSSHVMDEAERCGRLGLVRFGRMLAEGTSAQLRRLAGVERLEDAFLVLSESPQ